MFKKIGFAVVALAVGFFAVHASGLSSYTSTAWSKARNNLKNQVSLEFEIERVRNEVAQLVPDMKKNLSAIAEEMVAVENLQKEIAGTKAALAQQKENILTMTKDLDEGSTTLVYGGKHYSAARVQEKLDRDYASYKVCAAELKSKEQLLEAKERSLEATREQLDSLRSQKQELEIQVAQLEAEIKTVRLAQTRNQFHLDDSQLSRCKASLAEIRNRLNIEIRTQDLEAQFANDPIPVEKKAKPANELIKEIRAHFGDASRADSKLATDRNGN